MKAATSYVCGPSACPHDPRFEHDNYFGCIPRDFQERTGRSKTIGQVRGPDGRYYWLGGCKAIELAEALQ